MKNKTIYTNESLGKVRQVEDFLPSPDELTFKTDQVKVTLSLSKSSIQFFKKEAKKRHTPYQKMIRNLLDFYANRFRRCS
jgi:predicted DNA binding CopG/RHH family protein